MRESAVSVTSRRVRQSDFLRQHFEAQLERVEATGAAINAAANIADRRRRQLTLAEIELQMQGQRAL